MAKLKLTAVAAIAASLPWLTAAPAAVAGPWLVPWAVGHVIGAAARLATLPIMAAAAASSAGAPPPPVTPAPYWADAPPPVRYPSPGYYGPPSYYAPPVAYYAPPQGYNAPPVTYYGSPQHYYPVSAYRSPLPYLAGVPLHGPLPRYSVGGMRYSGPYGGSVFSRSRGRADRRW
jgi:hypothetical protein